MTREDSTPNWTSPDICSDPQNEWEALSNNLAYLTLPEHLYLKIQGPDAVTFLQGLLTTDVRKLQVGEATPSWLLNASGKIQVHLHLYKVDSKTLIAQTLAQEHQTLKELLDRYLIMEDATLISEGETHFSIQGPKSSSWVQDHPDILSIPNDRCGFGGYDLIGPKELLKSTIEEVSQCGWGTLHSARTQAFKPLYSMDMVAGVNPLIYGQLGSTISYHKGCFVGQETVARSRDRGAPPHLLVQLKGAPATCPQPQTPLTNLQGKSIGHMTSATTMLEGHTLAFARIKYAEAQLGAQLQDTSDTAWEITALSDVKGS